MTAIEIKADSVVEKMTDAEIKAEYKLVTARLEEIEPVVEGEELFAIMEEIEALRDYAAMLKCTVLARR